MPRSVMDVKLAYVLGAALALVPACQKAEKSETPVEETPTKDSPGSAPAAKPADGPPLAEGWTAIPLDSPGDAEPALGLAREAMKSLGQGLMTKLSSALEGANFAKGVEVCKNAAPQVRAEVIEEKKVQIGRTSFKVRNPENRPRPFAEPVVEARYAKEVLMRGPDDQVAYMAPIELGELCVKCHGTAEQIPDEVEKMLAEKYPEDEATGFAPGDLRGWFWVEVPAPAVGAIEEG